MNSRQLEYVLTIAKAGSFSEAARLLYVSQPSLSQYIQKLERELGVALFERTTPLRLTYAGMVYTAAAQEILEKEKEVRRVLKDIVDEDGGSVRVGAGPYSGVFVLSSAMRLFSRRHPKAKLELVEQVESGLPALLREGAFDFMVTTQPTNDPMFTVVPLLSEDFLLAVPREFALNERYEAAGAEALPFVSLRECEGYPFIALSGNPFSRQVFNELCQTGGLHPTIAVECVNLVTAYMQALSGCGIAFVPSSVLMLPQKTDTCRFYRIKGNPYRRNLVAVYRRSDYLPRTALWMLDILKEVCQNVALPDAIGDEL